MAAALKMSLINVQKSNELFNESALVLGIKMEPLLNITFILKIYLFIRTENTFPNLIKILLYCINPNSLSNGNS